jgi:hypothetical protein
VVRNLVSGQKYYYRAKCRDAAGQESVWSAAVASIQDATIPVSWILNLPGTQSTKIFDIYSSGTDTISGLSCVRLYYRRGTTGYFRKYGPSYVTGAPISVDTNLTGGDGTYSFYTLASDRSGNLEPVPAVPKAQTVVSTISGVQDPGAAEPESRVAGLPAMVDSRGLTISCATSGTSALMRRVSLYYRLAGETEYSPWAAPFISPAMTDTMSVQFDCLAADGAGTYEFCSIAEDRNGRVEAFPDQPDVTVEFRLSQRAAVKQWRQYR